MKLSSQFIKLPLQFDSERLAAEVAALPDAAWAKHPTGFQGNGAVRLISADGGENDDMGGAMQPTPHLLRSPYIQQVLASLDTVFGRSRLMGLGPHSEVPAHSDVNHHWFYRVRVHIPILTYPEVRFHCEDRDVHMAAGEAWIFDNWRRHWVINPTDKLRVHLVADTTGSASFWDLVGNGVDPFAANPKLTLRPIPFDPAGRPQLATEKFNMASVMPPAEMAFLVEDFLADLAVPADRGAIDQTAGRAYAAAVRRFVADWRDTWSQYGADREQWPRYQALRQSIAGEIVGKKLRLASNDSPATPALMGRVVLPCLALPLDVAPQHVVTNTERNPGFFSSSDEGHHTGRKVVSTMRAPGPTAASIVRSRFDRPLIILSAPRSGSTLLFETLQQSDTLCTIGGESHRIIEALPQLNPASGQIDSNRLDDSHATGEVATSLYQRFGELVRDVNGRAPQGDSTVRLLEKTPKNALRIPFLERLFPDAQYVFLYREPRAAISSIMESWNNGSWVTYPALAGWDGPWSFLLPPGWREMSGKPLAEIAAFQWRRANEFIVNDLAAIDGRRWMALDYADFLENPKRWTGRIAAFADIPFDTGLSARTAGPLPHSRLTLTAPENDKWRKNEAAIAPYAESVTKQYRDIQHFAATHHAEVGYAYPAQPAFFESSGRNDECPCGSGLRFKHCHGKLA